MALIELGIFSEALGMQTSVKIIIPQKSTVGEIGTDNKETSGKFKCLYLLHGLSDDETIWLRRSSIERYAAKYGICVVMPTGAKSFYSDMKYGMKYYTYIAKELPQIIEDMFNVSSAREDRYIGGLSMGGYGAMKIALTERGRYAAAIALSPVADIKNKLFADHLIPVFGDTIPDSADLFWLASEHNNDPIKPRIYMTVGENDFMYDDNIKLRKHFEMLDYDYTFVQTQGDHSWDLWDRTIQTGLEWML